MEHNREEKRDYYLEQIIGQTEEMDRLVVEMIEISKLDSEELILEKEAVSFRELAREQMARLEPAIREKGILVEYEGEEDFLVTGDRGYLARAVWNLLVNGVDYNLPGGIIRVRTERERWTVENTGLPMAKDQLRRAFELFYTGEESRSKRGKHMGMGLFLARKILGLHGLQVTIGNTENGVRVAVERTAAAYRTHSS